jgi:arginine/lysine/ornithine decarboxylase
MDQSDAPLLDALVDYRKNSRYGFTPPGHRQGRGTDDRVLSVLSSTSKAISSIRAGCRRARTC